MSLHGDAQMLAERIAQEIKAIRTVDLGGLTLVKCTQAAYDALGSGRPATTIYLIIG